MSLAFRVQPLGLMGWPVSLAFRVQPLGLAIRLSTGEMYSNLYRGTCWFAHVVLNRASLIEAGLC